MSMIFLLISKMLITVLGSPVHFSVLRVEWVSVFNNGMDSACFRYIQPISEIDPQKLVFWFLIEKIIIYNEKKIRSKKNQKLEDIPIWKNNLLQKKNGKTNVKVNKRIKKTKKQMKVHKGKCKRFAYKKNKFVRSTWLVILRFCGGGGNRASTHIYMR